MIKKLANSMVCFYVKNNYISENETSSYVYGFEILLSTLLNTLLVLVAALFMHSFIEAIFYMAAFISLRTSGGGYHAKSHRACILTFTVMFIVFCLTINILDGKIPAMYSLFCSMVSAIIIWSVAPVEAPNKPLSSAKRKRYRSISLVVGCVFMVLALVTYLTSVIPEITVYIFSGELAAALTMVAGAITTTRKEDDYESADP